MSKYAMLDTIADRIKLLGLKVASLNGYELSSFKRTFDKHIKYKITIDPVKEIFIQSISINEHLMFYSHTFTEKDFNTDFLSVICHLKTHLNTHQRNTDDRTIKQYLFGDKHNSD